MNVLIRKLSFLVYRDVYEPPHLLYGEKINDWTTRRCLFLIMHNLCFDLNVLLVCTLLLRHHP